MKIEKLSVTDVLNKIELIERTLSAWEQTAPNTLATLGGRDAILALSEMTCIGPVPRLAPETWAQASVEYQIQREIYSN